MYQEKCLNLQGSYAIALIELPQRIWISCKWLELLKFPSQQIILYWGDISDWEDILQSQPLAFFDEYLSGILFSVSTEDKKRWACDQALSASHFFPIVVSFFIACSTHHRALVSSSAALKWFDNCQALVLVFHSFPRWTGMCSAVACLNSLRCCSIFSH